MVRKSSVEFEIHRNNFERQWFEIARVTENCRHCHATHAVAGVDDDPEASPCERHEVAQELVSSTDVDVISFTGSNATGARIMAAAAPTMKKLSLELGGKSACLVFDDVDVERIAPQLAAAQRNLGGGAGLVRSLGRRRRRAARRRSTPPRRARTGWR